MIKRNFKRSLSFPFVDKRNHFLTKLFFIELNLVFCMVERLACFWNNQGTQRAYFGFSSDVDESKNPWDFKQPPPNPPPPPPTTIYPFTNSWALKITDSIKWYNCTKKFWKRSLVVRSQNYAQKNPLLNQGIQQMHRKFFHLKKSQNFTIENFKPPKNPWIIPVTWNPEYPLGQGS